MGAAHKMAFGVQDTEAVIKGEIAIPGGDGEEVKLTYFDIEGVAEKVRLALTLNGVEFTDERIKFPEWAALKPTTKYGQLPVMTIGDKAIAQSGAMLRWAAKQGDGALYPDGQVELALLIEEVVGLCEDMTRAWSPCLYLSMRPQQYGYPEDYGKTEEGAAKIKAMREAFVANDMPRYIKYFENFLEQNGGPFMCGSNVTMADCVLLPTLRNFIRGHIDHVPTTCLDGHPAIKAYIAAMMEVPKIKAWYS